MTGFLAGKSYATGRQLPHDCQRSPLWSTLSPTEYREVFENKLRTAMQTYILMTKLSPELTRRVKDRGDLGRTWLDEVKTKCPEVKFLAHYALLGPFDFLDIYEAPDEDTAARVSMISLSNGAFQAESWVAIPYKRFVELSSTI